MKTSSAVGLLLLTACTSSTVSDHRASAEQKAEKNTPLDQSVEVLERYWKLTELEGEPVVMTTNQDREAHFILKSEESRLTGYTGCNAFFGTYEIQPANRIRFKQVGSTKRACPDAQLKEFDFLQVFGLADNYRVRNNVLELNVGRRAPLAVFKSVEF